MSEQLPECLRAKEIAERLTGLRYRARGIITDMEWEAITEAMRRVTQHEVLVEGVLHALGVQTRPGWTGPSCCG